MNDIYKQSVTLNKPSKFRPSAFQATSGNCQDHSVEENEAKPKESKL